MQQIIIDEPYEFVPPHRGRFWPWILRGLIPRYLYKDAGVTEIETRRSELLEQSIDAGHGIILAPNHCRPCDPLVLHTLAKDVGTPFFIVASWHLFKRSRMTSFMVRRMGAFSIYREGMDRASFNCSIEILEKAERPLVIFPEGVVSRANDQLGTLMEGTAFMARAAARKRADSGGKVVIHPIAVRYVFGGDVEASVTPVLEDIEARLSWQSQKHMPLYERISKIGRALLGLKEIEYLDEAQDGTVFERSQRLIDRLLVPLEDEWLKGKHDGDVVARVKKLRSVILRDLVDGDVAEEERDRRWRQFADLYLAQNLYFYPQDYLARDATPERFIETVERFEEDLTDVCRPHPPMKVITQVCEAIEVGPERHRGEGDPVMDALEKALVDGLAELRG